MRRDRIELGGFPNLGATVPFLEERAIKEKGVSYLIIRVIVGDRFVRTREALRRRLGACPELGRTKTIRPPGTGATQAGFGPLTRLPCDYKRTRLVGLSMSDL